MNLLWFGNLDQVNSTPNNNATEAEADTLNGYHAGGPDEIIPVAVTGNTNASNFGTTYQSQTTSMRYTSPHTGEMVQSRITGFFSVEYTLTFPDGSTDIQTGVLIQMATGDIFFRPARSTLEEWDGITALRAVTVNEADTYPNGTRVADVSFSPDIFNLDIICFTAGTMILTDRGERSIEELAPGDMVWTRDNGFQPLRWHGRRSLSAQELEANPRLRPVRIRAGALGPNRPRRDLTVSPQHRILVRSQIAQRMFSAPELLVPARHLTEIDGIDELTGNQPVTYVHLLFDGHEVVMSDGAETESLYPGPQVINALGAAAEEIYAIFPELRENSAKIAGARPFATGHRARQLARRHAANQRALAS